MVFNDVLWACIIAMWMFYFPLCILKMSIFFCITLLFINSPQISVANINNTLMKIDTSMVADSATSLVEKYFGIGTRILFDSASPFSLEIANNIIKKIDSVILLNYQTCLTFEDTFKVPYINLLVIIDDEKSLMSIFEESCIKNTKYNDKVLVIVSDVCNENCLCRVANKLWSYMLLKVLILSVTVENITLYSYSPFSDKNSCNEITTLDFIGYADDRFYENLDNIFLRSLVNFNQCPLKAGTFRLAPYMFVIEKIDGKRVYAGPEILMLQSFARIFNFKLQLKFSKNKWSGVVELLGNESVSFTSTPVYLIDERVEQFSYVPYFQSYIVCFLPQPSNVLSWLKLAKPFHSIVWYVTICSFITFACVCFLILLPFKIQKQFDFTFLQFIGVIIGNSVSFKHKSLFFRYMFLLLLIFTFLLRNAYLASLINSLTTEQREMKFHTFSELISHNIPFGGGLLLKSDFIEYKIVYNNYKVLPYEEIDGYLGKVIKGLKFGLIIGENESINYINVNKFSFRSVYLLAEKVGAKYVGMLLPRFSFLTEMFYNKLLILESSGLLEKWKFHDLQFPNTRKKVESFIVLSLNHFTGLFYFYTCGIGFSLVTFLTEVIYYHFVKGQIKTI